MVSFEDGGAVCAMAAGNKDAVVAKNTVNS